MLCANCGQEIADGSWICPKCGAVLDPAFLPAESEPQQDDHVSAPLSDRPKKRPIPRMIGIAAAAAAVIVLIIVLIIVNSGSKSDVPADEPVLEDTAPEAESEDQVEDTPAVFAVPSGHYILTELTENGETYGIDQIADFGGESYLDMKDDGAFLFYYYPEDTSLEGTWDDTSVMTDDGPISYLYDPEDMAIILNDEDSGLIMTFTHESAAPVITYTITDESESETDAAAAEPAAESTAESIDYTLENFVVPETVIYDKGDITVTLSDVEDDESSGYNLNFVITNNSKKNIQVSSSLVAVNGCIFNGKLFASAASGETVNDTLFISYAELERAGLTRFFEFAIQAEIENTDTWDTIGTSGLIRVYVDEDAEAAGYETDALPDEELLFDSDGVQLYYMHIEGDGDYMMIVNNSGKDIYAYSENVSDSSRIINFGADVADGFRTVTAMTVRSNDDAAGSETAQFILKFADHGSWNSLFEDTAIDFTAFVKE